MDPNSWIQATPPKPYGWEQFSSAPWTSAAQSRAHHTLGQSFSLTLLCLSSMPLLWALLCPQRAEISTALLLTPSFHMCKHHPYTSVKFRQHSLPPGTHNRNFYCWLQLAEQGILHTNYLMSGKHSKPNDISARQDTGKNNGTVSLQWCTPTIAPGPEAACFSQFLKEFLGSTQNWPTLTIFPRCPLPKPHKGCAFLPDSEHSRLSDLV